MAKNKVQFQKDYGVSDLFKEYTKLGRAIALKIA